MCMPSVLVVDDTASIRFLIRTNLQLAGFDVDEAVDGVDCLEILAHREVLPDIITVDVMMPRLDGVNTVLAIRADPRTRDVAVVMVSTQGHPADIQRATRAGVDAYVTKPFDPDFLVQTVEEVLERTRERREKVRREGP
nr:response regulator [Aeromicrobium sp.]